MGEALKEIWKAKFKKAMESEHNIVAPATEKEIELLKFKIDMCLEKGDTEGFEKFSKELKSIESFLSLKGWICLKSCGTCNRKENCTGDENGYCSLYREDINVSNEYWIREFEKLYFQGYTIDEANKIIHQRRKEELKREDKANEQ